VIEGSEAAGVREAPSRADTGDGGFVSARVDEIVMGPLQADVLDDLVRRGAKRPLEALLERAGADTRPRGYLRHC
jgi:hypothetical protein